jgi:hypothetical protein
MKYAGLLVMPAGFFLSIAALVLFPSPAPRAAFVLCGLAVEGLWTRRRGAWPHGSARRKPFMNPTSARRRPRLTEAAFALTLVLLLLAPLAIAGIALINTGLGRSRSAAQALLGNLAMVAVTAIVFALVGATFSGYLFGSPPLRATSSTWPANPGTGSEPGPVSARRPERCPGPVAARAAL